jgi:hypothetical protein
MIKHVRPMQWHFLLLLFFLQIWAGVVLVVRCFMYCTSNVILCHCILPYRSKSSRFFNICIATVITFHVLGAVLWMVLWEFYCTASFGVRFRRINSWPNWLSSLQNLKFWQTCLFASRHHRFLTPSVHCTTESGSTTLQKSVLPCCVRQNVTDDKRYMNK